MQDVRARPDMPSQRPLLPPLVWTGALALLMVGIPPLIRAELLPVAHLLMLTVVVVTPFVLMATVPGWTLRGTDSKRQLRHGAALAAAMLALLVAGFIIRLGDGASAILLAGHGATIATAELPAHADADWLLLPDATIKTDLIYKITQTNDDGSESYQHVAPLVAPGWSGGAVQAWVLCDDFARLRQCLKSWQQPGGGIQAYGQMKQGQVFANLANRAQGRPSQPAPLIFRWFADPKAKLWWAAARSWLAALCIALLGIAGLEFNRRHDLTNARGAQL